MTKRKQGVVHITGKNTKRLNVRRKAGMENDVTGIIHEDDTVEIISKVKDKDGNDWYHILEGYVMARHIAEG